MGLAAVRKNDDGNDPRAGLREAIPPPARLMPRRIDSGKRSTARGIFCMMPTRKCVLPLPC